MSNKQVEWTRPCQHHTAPTPGCCGRYMTTTHCGQPAQSPAPAGDGGEASGVQDAEGFCRAFILDQYRGATMTNLHVRLIEARDKQWYAAKGIKMDAYGALVQPARVKQLEEALREAADYLDEEGYADACDKARAAVENKE